MRTGDFYNLDKGRLKKIDTSMSFLVQDLRISGGGLPSLNRCMYLKSKDLSYGNLSPLLPLISNSFSFVTCLKFPIFLTSIPVNYYCCS
jgi:hypothetical protein